MGSNPLTVSYSSEVFMKPWSSGKLGFWLLVTSPIWYLPLYLIVQINKHTNK